MSQRTPYRDLMSQPKQVNDTSAPDTMPVGGASPNAMSAFAPAPACPECNNPHSSDALGTFMAKRLADNARYGVMHGRPANADSRLPPAVEDEGDSE
jgi:hypothetical protein